MIKEVTRQEATANLEVGLPILHAASAVGRSSFGVGSVVQQLSIAQRRLGARPVIWTTDGIAEANKVRQDMGLGADCLVTYPVIGPSRFAYSPAMERAAMACEDCFPLSHVHAVWTACSRVALHRRRRFGCPYVISAHGSLDEWALRRSRLRKWLARKVFAQNMLQRASCLHAMGENEVAAYRDIGLKNPIALIPNGVSDDWIDSRGNADRFRLHCDLARGTRVLLFLSRVTPKKGLPLLFEAMDALRERLANWRLVIVGPDEFGHTRELRQIAQNLGIERFVKLVGPLYGELRRDAFAAADVFVLPTHSEGNPLAALEALGAGVPVLTTRGAPCDYLLAHDCGWWTNASSGSIREALEDAIGRGRDSLAVMGERGREVVRESFTWTRIGKMTLQLYNWLLGRADKPDFVLLD